jgi:hypothetical protein
MPHQEPKFRIRVIRGDQMPTTQNVAWPSLDGASGGGGGEMPLPLALPKDPVVELIRQPDNTFKIIVTCTCGKRIEVACEV